MKLWNTKPMRLRRWLSSEPRIFAWTFLPSKRSVPDCDLLQPVDGADQRRLAGPGRAAHHDDLAARDLGVDVDERMVRPILLIDVRRSGSWARQLPQAGYWSWLGRQSLGRQIDRQGGPGLPGALAGDASLEHHGSFGQAPAYRVVDDRQDEKTWKGLVRSWLLIWFAAKVSSGTLIT